MRTIKFRAWDKESKEMVTTVFNIVLRIGEPLENKRFEFMQYTGLKDKNGKEIYEGDIVKDSNNRIIEVKWVENGWNLLGKYKIIGNIYQNPDLVK